MQQEVITLNETVGMIIAAIVAVAGCVGVVIKVIKPINDLNLNIVRLTAAIDKLSDNDNRQDERIAYHGRQIDGLCLKTEGMEEHMRVMEKWGYTRPV